MELPDLKKLSKVVDLCRKKGIKSIKIDNVEITLADYAPPTKTRRPKATAAQTPATSKFPTMPTPQEIIESDGQLTEEQLLFYSVGDSLEMTESN